MATLPPITLRERLQVQIRILQTTPKWNDDADLLPTLRDALTLVEACERAIVVAEQAGLLPPRDNT